VDALELCTASFRSERRRARLPSQRSFRHGRDRDARTEKGVSRAACPEAPSSRRRFWCTGCQGGPSFGANGGSASQVGAAGNPRGEIVALKALDLEIRDGEFFGLLGPNGAGKTTTIGILTTRVRPTSGKALIGGADVATQAVQVRQRIGVVPQRPNPDRSLNVIENLLFHAAYFGI